MLLSMFVFVHVAKAQEGGCHPPDGGEPSCAANGVASQSEADAKAAAGNPVNLINGNKYQREEDLPALPGVLGLEIIRHYNSVQAKENAPNGLLGRGWRLSYETELHVIGKTVQILQADGRLLIFTRNPDRPNLCGGSDPAQGTIRIEGRGESTVYFWVWPEGRELRFNAGGRLEQIRAPAGETVKLFYAPNGRLLRVKDPQERELQMVYPNREALRKQDRFQGVMAIQSPIGRFEYGYENSGGGSRLANLIAVLNPDGNIRRYHYEDPLQPGFLTGIVAGSRDGTLTRISRYAYDENGEAIYSAHGYDVVHLNRRAGETIVTDGVGRTTTFTHAIVGNRFRVLEARGEGCPGCGPVNHRYQYDDLGRTVEDTTLDRNGQPIEALQTIRDSRGRIQLQSTISYLDGQPPSERVRVRYEYTGDHQQPTRIVRYRVSQRKGSGVLLVERKISVSYDDDGRIESIRGGDVVGRSALVRFSYDERGYLKSREMSDGSRMEIEERTRSGLPMQVLLHSPAMDGAQRYEFHYDRLGQMREIRQKDRALHLNDDGAFQNPVRSIVERSMLKRIGMSQQDFISEFLMSPFGKAAFAASTDGAVVLEGAGERDYLATYLELSYAASTVSKAEPITVDRYAALAAPEGSSVDQACVYVKAGCEEIERGLKYGALSKCVYVPATCDLSWKRVMPEELDMSIDDFFTGVFAAELFQSSETGELVLAFRGTDDIYDWVDNFGQGLGARTTEQYEKAMRLARVIQERYPDQVINITGHSLGGGLATAASLATGSRAYVFNAASVHPEMAARNGLDYGQASSNVDLYFVEGEVLTTAQDMGPVSIPTGNIFSPFVVVDGPSAPGHRILLAPPDERWVAEHNEPAWYLPASLEKALTLHGMDAVLEALRRQAEMRNCKTPPGEVSIL